MKFLSDRGANSLLSKIKGYIDYKTTNNPIPDVTIPPYIDVKNFSLYNMTEPNEDNICNVSIDIIRMEYLLPVGATLVSASMRYIKKDGYNASSYTTATLNQSDISERGSIAISYESIFATIQVNPNELSGMWQLRLIYNLNGTSKSIYSFFYGWGEIPIPTTNIYKLPYYKIFDLYLTFSDIQPDKEFYTNTILEEIGDGKLMGICGWRITATLKSNSSKTYADYTLTRLEIAPRTNRLYARIFNIGEESMSGSISIRLLVGYNLDIGDVIEI